ncbi:MAG TPA: hypothetical protein VJ183_12025 [Chloroflexia bacterium]|nr:hypothetical protein [Chloroflexia bacterium]
MGEENEFLGEILSGIGEADVITIFFPLLRRALVVDTRHDLEAGPMVQVDRQARSMEERIASIEKMRPQFGRVRAILGIPWVHSVKRLQEEGIADCLFRRLLAANMSPYEAQATVDRAIDQLWRYEQMAFARMIQGTGFATLWTAKR